MDTEPAGTGPSAPEPAEVLWTKHDVADYLRVKPETVVRRYRKWGLDAHKAGRELRFKRSDVIRWIEGR